MASSASTADLKRRAAFLASQSFVVLAVSVPKDNQKTPQAMEQFFAAMHGIFRDNPIEQEHLSFELVARKESIIFYVFTPLHLRDFVERQLYAQYPDLQISQVPDYTQTVVLEGQHVASTVMKLTKEDVYPIKTFAGTDVDPLAGITAVLAGLEDNEQVWFQMVTRPVGDKWQEKGVKYVQAVRKTGKEPGGVVPSGTYAKVGRAFLRVAKELMQPGTGTGDMKKVEEVKLSAPQEAALKGIESKITKLGFETIFRIVAISPTDVAARSRTQGTLAAFKQFNTTNLNGFTGGESKMDNITAWEQYIAREFEEKGSILNIEELASVYHFPAQSVEVSAIGWAGSKKGESPFNLPLVGQVSPEDLTILGRTDFRGSGKEFGIKMDDRMRHVYVIGKSGTGKSTLLENMAIDDVREGRGVIIIDPHGELADKVVDAVPRERIGDVILFDPSDRNFPVAFNILDVTNEDQKGNIASGFVSALKKIFGNSWGPRLEYILRNATLAILDAENPTMLGIPRMLTDAGFRNHVIPQIKDQIVLDFWKNEWAAKDAKQQVEEMGSILNKVGQFLSSSLIRNIVGQPKSGFDMRRAMDERKILIVNLSKGKIGEDNSALLGTMMITKVQLAAMSRADVPPSQRPQCFLYVDEFQNFATESFATILSEARKYNLSLTIAHQYIAQMTPEVKDAVFGNVGSMISFRVGSEDANALTPEFTPVFDANDLVNLQRGHVYVKLLIDGLAVPAFSAKTYPPVTLDNSLRPEIIEYSHSHYARSRADAEALIDETAGYKQRREAEAAAKAAKEALAAGSQAIGIRPGGANQAPRPDAPPVRTVSTTAKPHFMESRAEEQGSSTPVETPQPERRVVPERVEEPATPVPSSLHTEHIPSTSISSSEADYSDSAERGSEPAKERVEKPLKVLEGYVYKEVSQRGGMRWFLGEQEEAVIARAEEKKRAREIAALEAAKNPPTDSPTPTLPTEQRANENEVGVESKNTHTPHMKSDGEASAEDVFVLPIIPHDE